MDNKNIVIMLREGVSSATNQKIYPTDIAALLGYGGTQLKEYFKLANRGETKTNARLERAARFAYRLGELEGFESLFPLIPKLSGELDDDEWSRRTCSRMDKMISADQSTAGQIDLVEKLEKAENDDQTKSFYGNTSPLALNQIQSDIEHGHIAEGYDRLIAQLNSMFGEQGHYEFSEVKAALVTLECPSMVQKMKASFTDEFSALCHDIVEKHLAERVADLDIRTEIANRIPTALNQLGINTAPEDKWLKAMLETFIIDLKASDDKNLYKLANVRVLRRELSDSQRLKSFLIETENAHQNSDIMWPEFVSKQTKKDLHRFDTSKIEWALEQKGEKVINRILAGYVKEVKNG